MSSNETSQPRRTINLDDEEEEDADWDAPPPAYEELYPQRQQQHNPPPPEKPSRKETQHPPTQNAGQSTGTSSLAGEIIFAKVQHPDRPFVFSLSGDVVTARTSDMGLTTGVNIPYHLSAPITTYLHSLRLRRVPPNELALALAQTSEQPLSLKFNKLLTLYQLWRPTLQENVIEVNLQKGAVDPASYRVVKEKDGDWKVLRGVIAGVEPFVLWTVKRGKMATRSRFSLSGKGKGKDRNESGSGGEEERFEWIHTGSGSITAVDVSDGSSLRLEIPPAATYTDSELDGLIACWVAKAWHQNASPSRYTPHKSSKLYHTMPKWNMRMM